MSIKTMQVRFCDVCGSREDIQTITLRLNGAGTYHRDLCRQDFLELKRTSRKAHRGRQPAAA